MRSEEGVGDLEVDERIYGEGFHDVEIIAYLPAHVHEILIHVDTIVQDDLWCATPEQHACLHAYIPSLLLVDCTTVAESQIRFEWVGLRLCPHLAILSGLHDIWLSVLEITDMYAGASIFTEFLLQFEHLVRVKVVSSACEMFTWHRNWSAQ